MVSFVRRENMKEKIYIVFGTTGEYSDRYQWIVCAFRDESQAKELIKKATARYNEILQAYESRYDIPEGANEFDPKMSVDYTGTEYYIEEADLVTA